MGRLAPILVIAAMPAGLRSAARAVVAVTNGLYGVDSADLNVMVTPRSGTI